jgi:hypothetical protein
LDGSSASDEIKAFQRWVWYTKGDKSLKTSKAFDGVDGIFGSKTRSAWAKYGSEYTNVLTPTNTPTTNVDTTPISTVTETVTTETVANKQGWWSKRTKTQKGLIIGGGVAIAIVLGVLIYKRSKKSKI